MTSISHRNVKQFRAGGNPRAAAWIAMEVEGGYLVRCGDAVLSTVNGRKPRLFRKLDSVVSALKSELGVTEFEVKAME